MSIKFSSVRKSDLREEEGTPGGRTYWIRDRREDIEKPLCFRVIHGQPDMRCSNPAGYKTWHNGTGACAFHGGAASDNPAISHGKYATVSKSRLAGSIDKYLNQDRGKLLDLTEQLAFSKAIFEEFQEKFPDPNDDMYGVWLGRFLNLIGSLGNLVEKMSRIESRNALTAAQVLYLRATVADILMKYIPDPAERTRAAKELASRLGGDVSADMRPSEIYDLPAGSV